MIKKKKVSKLFLSDTDKTQNYRKMSTSPLTIFGGKNLYRSLTVAISSSNRFNAEIAFPLAEERRFAMDMRARRILSARARARLCSSRSSSRGRNAPRDCYSRRTCTFLFEKKGHLETPVSAAPFLSMRALGETSCCWTTKTVFLGPSPRRFPKRRRGSDEGDGDYGAF